MAQATLTHAVETKQSRAALVRHAGMRRISPGSVVAGTLAAYGVLAALVAVVAAIGEAVGFDPELSTGEWRRLGAAGGAALAVGLLLSYLFGGYVAGRMARRAGATNGAMVFVIGLLVALGVAGLVNLFTDGDAIARELRDRGIPTTSEVWREVIAVAGAGAVLAMLAGSVLGGAMGERWHAKLLARAADPTYGPEAAERAAAARHQEAMKHAQERAVERHDAADEEVRHAAATSSVVPPPGWYEEPAAADGGAPAGEDEPDRRHDRGPRHRMRVLR